MAKMTRLHDPISIDLGMEWTVVVSSAGLYGDGTRADLHLYNGTIQDAALVRLSIEKERQSVSEKFAQVAQVEIPIITAALLEAKDQIEALLRITDGEEGQSVESFDTPSIVLDDVEPWDDPVDAGALITALQGVVERFLALPKGGSYTIALWILHTYLLDAVSTSPILSPARERGGVTCIGLH